MDYNVVTTDHCAVDYLTFKFEVKIQGGSKNFKNEGGTWLLGGVWEFSGSRGHLS